MMHGFDEIGQDGTSYTSRAADAERCGSRDEAQHWRNARFHGWRAVQIRVDLAQLQSRFAARSGRSMDSG